MPKHVVKKVYVSLIVCKDVIYEKLEDYTNKMVMNYEEQYPIQDALTAYTELLLWKTKNT